VLQIASLDMQLVVLDKNGIKERVDYMAIFRESLRKPETFAFGLNREAVDHYFKINTV
jgi:hypothetical protein